MKVSTRVEYGLIALTDIAVYSEENGTVSSAEISEREDISQKYLEQILLGLRQGGFIKGQKGSRGGYRLSRSADKITLAEILNSLDNNILADSFESGDEPSNAIRESVNTCLWDKLNGYLRSFTEQLTLNDLIRECRKAQDKRKSFMYYI